MRRKAQRERGGEADEEEDTETGREIERGGR